MNEKTLKFDNIVVNKKEFHKSKQPIDLVLINVDQIVISWKFKRKDVVLIFFLATNKMILLNRIISPQVSGYIKYFENGAKISHSWLKMMMYWLNILKFVTLSIKIS